MTDSDAIVPPQPRDSGRGDMNVDVAIELAYEALYTDGAHHKQWYLEQILSSLGAPLPDESVVERGIAP